MVTTTIDMSISSNNRIQWWYRDPANSGACGGTFNLSLIDMDEGVRMLSRVVDMPADEVQIGMRVKARIEELNGAPAVVWEEAQWPRT